MSIKVNPKVKIGAGLVMMGGGVFELVNASNSKGTVRVIHYVAAAGLLVSGGIVARNGWKSLGTENNKLNPDGSEKVKDKDNKSPDSLKKIIENVSNELKKPIEKGDNSTTRSQEKAKVEAVVNDNLGSELSNASGLVKSTPKVVGKINAEKLDQTKRKQSQIKKRLDLLRSKLRGIKTNGFDGHQQALGLKNEIALLTAQHRLVGSGSDFN